MPQAYPAMRCPSIQPEKGLRLPARYTAGVTVAAPAPPLILAGSPFSAQRRGVFYGWVIVAASFIACEMPTFNPVLSLFLLPMTQDFG